MSDPGLASGKPLLDVLRGERRVPPPIWLMRQAGRYLPEYRALRADKGGFVDLVDDPEAAAEVTLQPIRRFGFDGAILFADILLVPRALGQRLWFEAGEGPRLAPPILDRTALDVLAAEPARLAPVFATVRRVAAQLPPGVTLLGFAGAPWTVATYMIAGEGSRDQAAARELGYRDPGLLDALIGRIEAMTLDYLTAQADAGVEAVQLFESWAGSLSPAQFERWVIAPNARIVAQLRRRRPGLPVIAFPKGAGGKLPAFAREVRPDALGLDETVDPAWAAAALPPGLPVQGNLDPVALLAGGPALEEAVERITVALADRPHIFNLGHGILKETPVDHVLRLLQLVRGRCDEGGARP